MRHRSLLVALAVVVASASAAPAGTVILGTRTPKGGPTEIQVQDGRVRMTSAPGHAVYYDHAKRIGYFVNTAKGTYVEVNEARVQQAAGAGAGADVDRRMQAELAKLPPEKRALVESMMKKQGDRTAAAPPAAPAPLVKAGAGVVGAWKCERYTGRGGGSEVTVCAAPAASVGVAPADFAALEGLRALTRLMAERARAAGQIDAPPDDGYEGLPLERVETRDGTVVERFVVTSIRREDVPIADVTLPPGLKAIGISGGP